jgi:hypothetical protein
MRLVVQLSSATELKPVAGIPFGGMYPQVLAEQYGCGF